MTLVAGVLGAGSLCFLALESLELVFLALVSLELGFLELTEHEWELSGLELSPSLLTDLELTLSPLSSPLSDLRALRMGQMSERVGQSRMGLRRSGYMIVWNGHSKGILK